MTSIHASSLAVGYGKRPVVDNISLDLQPGELLVLIGTNGSENPPCSKHWPDSSIQWTAR